MISAARNNDNNNNTGRVADGEPLLGSHYSNIHNNRRTGGDAACDSDPRLAQLRSDIDEVKRDVVTSIDKVLERGSKLAEIEHKTVELNQTANQFRRTAHRVRRKFWWRNVKRVGAAVAVGLAIVVVVVLAVAL